MTRDDDRTPPKIVAASERQSHALAVFIGQELERWGFAVSGGDGDGRKLTVNADGYEFRVEVTRFL